MMDDPAGRVDQIVVVVRQRRSPPLHRPRGIGIGGGRGPRGRRPRLGWVSHRVRLQGPPYTATATVLYAHELGLVPITTPAYSPEQSFAKPYPHAVAMVPEKVVVKQVHLDEMIQICMIVSMAARPLPGGEEGWTMREPLLEGIRAKS